MTDKVPMPVPGNPATRAPRTEFPRRLPVAMSMADQMEAKAGAAPIPTRIPGKSRKSAAS